jgi:L-ascorbate metabolism protein UlaG (beta-lactamase superfamily)
LGHAGFKISFSDKEHPEVIRNIYIDTWLENPKAPEDIKGAIPDDADLVLCTHGHFDHTKSAPDLVKNSRHVSTHCKLMSNGEISKYFTKYHDIKE